MGGDLYFKDNGAKILLVAHLDHVQPHHWAGVLKFKEDTKVYCSNLDDRAGAYIILDMLAKTNVKYDILLTTNEEQRASSAIWFEPPTGKKYNWIAEFDRKGQDVVAYQYKTSTDWAKALRSEGFDFCYGGSYTDIVDLEHLGVCGVNIGIGMKDYHTMNASLSLNVLREQVAKFLSFYEHYSEIKFKFSPRLNKLTKDGLVYDPNIVGRFTLEEIKFIEEDLYERFAMGTDPELGESLTLYQIRTIMRKELENSSSSGKTLVSFPVNSKPPNPHDFRPKFKSNFHSKNLHIVKWTRCIECGKQFEVKPEYTNGKEAFCPACYAKTIEKAKSESAIDNDIASTLMANLRTSTNPIIIGSAFKKIRQNLSKAKVGELIHLLELEGDKNIRGKIKEMFKADRRNEAIITQRLMAAIIDKAKLPIADKTSVINLRKWISRVESGNKYIWEDPREVDLIRYYIELLSQHIEPTWAPLLEKLEFTVIEAVKFLKLNPKKGVAKLPEHKVETKGNEKLIVKAKFPLNTSLGKDYSLTVEPNDKLKIWKWKMREKSSVK